MFINSGEKKLLLDDSYITLDEAILQGSVSRLRPVIMTALMAMLGLLPAALSTSTGSETIKPFAVVIIGGLITATLLTLTMLPALYRYFEEQQQRDKPL